jgi:hypothetical protein
MFVDPSGLEKQLLADIENGNSFIVELVARWLDFRWWWIWVHTFIRITSSNGNMYTLWWYDDNWILIWDINRNVDMTRDKWFKWEYNIIVPSSISSQDFAKNIYNEFNYYNENQRVYDMWSSSKNWAGSDWNCNNFSTTLLYYASWEDKEVMLNYINSLDPRNLNPGLGEPFIY